MDTFNTYGTGAMIRCISWHHQLLNWDHLHSNHSKFEGSDLFGLGATLHHVVTLSPPWDSVEDVKAARKMKIEKQERRKKVQAAIKEEVCWHISL